MITKGEAAMLLTTINAHHGNAQWDDLQLDEFYRELDKRNNIQDMRTAVVRFYATKSDKWMRAADINILCKKIRASRIPDENTIQQLAAKHHVTADDYWEFKRRVVFGTAREAQELGEAVSKALEQADRPQIASNPSHASQPWTTIWETCSKHHEQMEGNQQVRHPRKQSRLPALHAAKGQGS